MPPNPPVVRPVPFVWDTLVRLASREGTVVDVGCGAAPYRPAFTARYIGVDITDAPYTEGVPRNVDIVAPAHAIPLETGSADLLYTVGAFHLMGDLRLVLAEFRRVLRPGGRLLIFDYNRRTLRELG